MNRQLSLARVARAMLWLGLASFGVAWLAGPADALVTVRGIVRDQSGAPIFNADFNVYESATGAKLLASDKTDVTGAYKLILDPGVYNLLCQVKDPNRGFAPEIKRDVVVSASMSLDYVLPPSVQVRGRVITANGNNPVYPCNLDFDRSDDGARQPSLGNLTSPFGTFIDYIEAGTYTLTANPADTALAPTRLYRVQAPPTDILLLPVEQAAFLAGTVRDSNGAPVEGAIFRFDDAGDVRHPAKKDTSDLTGFFRVGVAPGVYRVTVEPQRRSHLAAIRVPGVDLTRSFARDFTLPVGVAISGRVTDKRGLPVSAADWDAILESTNTTAATPTDNTTFDGSYRYVVARGLYKLRLTPPASSGLDSVVIQHVSLERDTTINVDYAALGGGGGGDGSPVLRFGPAGNPTHTTAGFALVLTRPVARALVEIYDVSGRRARVVHDGPLAAGTQPLAWDGRRDNGAQAHTGVFFVRARMDGHESVTRFVLLP